MKRLVAVWLIFALLVPALADAAPGQRMRFVRAATSGDLGAQTTYWGPSTLVGNGGEEICAAPCVSPWSITSGTPVNFQRDADDGLLVPKDGAAGTPYNGVRTTGPITNETFTITDAIGQTKVIYAIVDESRAGRYTIRPKPSLDNVGGVLPQLTAVIRQISYGQEIAWRAGSRFNTPDQSGVFNGTAAYSLRNDGPIDGTFTGENHVVIRPETGGTATLGPMYLEGQENTFPGQRRLDGLRFQNLTFYSNVKDIPLIQSVLGVSNLDVWDSVFTGDEGNWLTEEVPRPRGILKDTNSGRWRVHRTLFQYLANGATLPNAWGVPNGGPDTYSDPTNVYNEVIDSTFRGIYGDAISMPCATGAVVTGNLFTDKTTGVTMGGPGYYNPFNKAVQPHGDAIQFSQTSCGWGRLAGPLVANNIITRGYGRDSLPFWTEANGYPNPNTPGSSCCLVPDPTKGYDDYQGIFANNSEAGNPNHLDYPVVWVNPVIRHNFIQISMNNGIVLPAMENPIVEFNVAITDEPGPANLLEVPYGAVNIRGGPVTGTGGRLQYNVGTSGVTLTVASGASVDFGTGSGISGGTNMLAPRSNYTTLFDSPLPTRRTYLEAVTGWRPKIGGPLFVNPNQPAGMWCADGSLRSAAACP